MKIISVEDVQKIIDKKTIPVFFQELIKYLEADFADWKNFEFSLMPRPAVYYKDGVIELMPISNQALYSYKYVNGHPNNYMHNKPTVMAVGQLSDAETGNPLLYCEMTLLTAFRTAATSAMVAKYLANENAKNIALIGTGAQSEFQLLAFASIFPIENIYYFDIDSRAMDKFAINIKKLLPNVNLHACSSAKRCLSHGAEIVTTMTAAKKRTDLFEGVNVQNGTFINAIGGDAPDKTELGENLLRKAKIVVEYTPQTIIEGEIQYLGEALVYAELWELISYKKTANDKEKNIYIFDSVGFALEDFSTLRLVYDICNKENIGTEIYMIPQLEDVKNLISAL